MSGISVKLSLQTTELVRTLAPSSFTFLMPWTACSKEPSA